MKIKEITFFVVNSFTKYNNVLSLRVNAVTLSFQQGLRLYATVRFIYWQVLFMNESPIVKLTTDTNVLVNEIAL